MKVVTPTFKCFQTGFNTTRKYHNMEWEELQLKLPILRGILSVGFERPSAIQSTAIPAITAPERRDVIAQAQSGTGKTGAFCVSALQSCTEDQTQQVLILSPTHELATQTYEVMTKLAAFTALKVKLLIGGTSVDADIRDMRSNPQIIVGTPGRVQDFLVRRIIHGNTIAMIILDEADEILSMGFMDQLHSIFTNLASEAQVVLFSATLPESLADVTRKIMRNPHEILVKAEELSLKGISQFYVEFDDNSDEQKLAALQDLYQQLSVSQTIIYCNSVRRVMSLYTTMKQSGYPVCCIHRDMPKAERTQAYQDFKSGMFRVLISSNVTSRGIDIQQVSVVVNFDIPHDVSNYLHRIGRSGRWGRKGLAINFVTKYDIDKLRDIERYYSITIDPLPANYGSMC